MKFVKGVSRGGCVFRPRSHAAQFKALRSTHRFGMCFSKRRQSLFHAFFNTTGTACGFSRDGDLAFRTSTFRAGRRRACSVDKRC